MKHDASTDSPEEMLGRHVWRILSFSSVPSDDEADVAEELFGHLWQVWQEEKASGLDSRGAALAAIEAFGTPEELAPGLTRAFHGRLYASTIGILLPAVVPPADRPAGFTLCRLLLGIVFAFGALGLVISILTEPYTPLRQLEWLAGVVAYLSLVALAYRALLRQQRWALRYVQVLAVGVVIAGIVMLLGQPITVNFLAIYALVVLPAAFGRGLAEWVAGSRSIGIVLGAVIVLGALGPWALDPVVAAVPDPTVAGPGDLSMVVSAQCTANPDGATSAGTITVDLRWSRTDLLPHGLLGAWQGMGDPDNLQVASPEDAQNGLSPIYFPSALTVGDESFVDVQTGADAALSYYQLAANPYFQPAGNGFAVDPGTIVAGREYRATFTVMSDLPPDASAFRVTYAHRNRWGLEALLGCGQTNTAQPVSRDPPQTVFYQ
jgi:hypothetical protein